MTSHGPQFFISYHRTDLPVAEQVRSHLLAQQVKTWMDHYDIPAGAYWPDEIDRGLAESDLVVGLLSPDSVASRNVKNEWDWAIQNGKQLILLVTRPCVIPHRYVSINFIDATHDGIDAALAELVQIPDLRPKQPELAVPRTRYARSGDVSVAYQVFGEGPIDLVAVPGFISHVEYTWKLPGLVAWFRRLASFSRVIMFDKRGTGMSDRTGRIATMEERMDDIRAVMDASQSERAVIMGVSEGVPLSVLFAAAHPERSQALILYGGSATYVQQPDYPWRKPLAEQLRQSEADEASLFETWGAMQMAREEMAAWLAPSAVDDESLVAWFAELMRLGASPGAIIALDRMNLQVDVRHVLPTIRVPTLVVNRTGDRDAKIEEARYIAARIPGAVLAEFPGDDHFFVVGDQESLLDAIERFVNEQREQPPVAARETILATVVHLAGDGVNAADLRAAAERAAGRFKGRIVAGESGINAIFDGPGRAIRFADAVSAAQPGGQVRSGIQTGEIELAENGVSGQPVEIAQRLAGLAAPGQVLATGIVRDLVAGSGIRFDAAPEEQTRAMPDGAQVLVVDRESLR
jgi:pimeloyl-ACP methyl ester carboxylesterase